MSHDWLDDIPRIATAFVAFVKRLRLGTPGRMAIRSREETNMGFRYTFHMPAPSNAVDWSKREIIVSVNGVEQPTVEVTPKDAAISPAFDFADNDAVSLAVGDTDDAGNRSVGEPLAFQVIDDVAPGEPGSLSIASKTEI